MTKKTFAKIWHWFWYFILWATMLIGVAGFFLSNLPNSLLLVWSIGIIMDAFAISGLLGVAVGEFNAWLNDKPCYYSFEDYFDMLLGREE
jgi:hypothetical protein